MKIKVSYEPRAYELVEFDGHYYVNGHIPLPF